jgi:hypothetical protein
MKSAGHRARPAAGVEVGQRALDDVELDAAEVGARGLAGLVVGRVEVDERSTVWGIRRAGIFAATPAERGAALERPAADHDEVLRHGARPEPPHAALEADGRDVVQAAAVRATADLDARGRPPLRSDPDARAGALRAAGRGRATA